MPDATEAVAVSEAMGGPSTDGESQAAVPWVAKAVAWSALNLGRVSAPRFIAPAFHARVRRRGGTLYMAKGFDGVDLACIHLPGKRTAETPPRLTVFLMHGWVETKELHLFRAYPLQDAGHDVVLIDHRGHGGSTPTGVTFGVKEREDLRCVIDDAAERGWLGDIGRVITMGHSMGAATCLMHAALDDRVASVVAMGPYATITGAIKAFRRRIPGIDYVFPWRWTQGGFAHELERLGGSIDDAEPLRAIGRVTAPVLLIEGGRDTLVPPPEHTQRLMDAERIGPMERLTVAKANHFTLSRLAWKGVGKRVRRFCAEVSDAMSADGDISKVLRNNHTDVLARRR
ncbi:MAG: alpha/beta fold hydrolase [Planctomycetota bacterium]